MITPEDEKRFKLAPLPDTPFCGEEEGQRKRSEYEAMRRAWRRDHPLVPSEDK